MTKIEVYPSMVVVKTILEKKSQKAHARGDVRGFTPESRLRMLKFLHSIEFKEGVLITLTYGKDFPCDCVVYHRHLQTFRKWFERRYGKVCAVWKLEYQKRGAPHFHIFVMGLTRVCIPCCSRAWHKINECKDHNNLRIGFDVKGVSEKGGVRRVGAYISKYMSKEVIDDQHEGKNVSGRFWGRWNIKSEKPSVYDIPTQAVCGVIAAALQGQEKAQEYYLRKGGLNVTVFSGQVGESVSRETITKVLAGFEKRYNKARTEVLDDVSI